MNCSLKRLALMIVAASVCSAVSAAPPKITRLSVRGFQSGGTTRVTVQGTDLGAAPQLLLGVPVKEQKLIGQAKPTTAEFDVALDPSTAAGVYHLRVQTDEGVSAPEIVTIDALPQFPAAASNTMIKKLPVAVHGTLAGSTVQEATFVGRKGQTVTIDVLARRMGSKLRPVVHLYDAVRRQLAWSLPQTAFNGDARLTATLPADGNYTAAVHDLTYAAAAPAYYRLAIGAFDYVDQVYPPVVERGTSTPLVLIGRFGEHATVELTATATASATAASSDFGDSRPLPWPVKSAPVGLRPRVQLSDLTETVEDRTLDATRVLPSLPAAVSGRLAAPGEIDRYFIDLAADEKIQVEVFADRLGSPIDATLELLDEKGARLAQIDDVVGPDPRLEYTSAKKSSRVTIAVGDALRRGDETCVYRIVVTRLDKKASREDFRLTFAEDTHNVLTDGTKVFRVMAVRNGYDGAIRLTVKGLPKGFSATPVEIPVGAAGALVELRQSATADNAAVGQIVIQGDGVGAKPALVRVAESAVHPLGGLQPWMKSELVVAASQTPAPLIAVWGDDSTAPPTLYQGTDDKLAVRLKRDPTTKGAVRLSLVTTQAAPTGTPQQNASLMLRGIAPTVDVKPDAKKETAEFAVRVPADLPQADYDLAIRAELLSDDGKKTVAEAYTAPRRYHAAAPIEIVADAQAGKPIELDAKRGAAIALSGTLKRLRKYAGDVTITLVGLPAGIAAPSAVLKPKKDDYRLEFKLPPAFAATKIEGVKISAMITPDNRRANTAGKAELPVPTILVSRPVSAKLSPSAAAPTKPAK